MWLTVKYGDGRVIHGDLFHAAHHDDARAIHDGLSHVAYCVPIYRNFLRPSKRRSCKNNKDSKERSYAGLMNPSLPILHLHMVLSYLQQLHMWLDIVLVFDDTQSQSMDYLVFHIVDSWFESMFQ